MHLGFVHTFTPPVVPDSLKSAFGPMPIFLKLAFGAMESSSAPTFGPSPDAIRLWAKYFSTVDHSLPTVTVPAKWMNFFTLLLLKQSSFDWVKDFLQSSAWQTILQTILAIPFHSLSLKIGLLWSFLKSVVMMIQNSLLMRASLAYRMKKAHQTNPLWLLMIR